MKKKIIENLVWSSSSSSYANLRIFCCVTYANVNHGKLEPRKIKCIFLGYANGVKEYKLLCPYSTFSKCLIRYDC